MQKWEYSRLAGMTQTFPEYPAYYRMTRKGNELVEDFKKLPKGTSLQDAVAQFIAQLGEDGWEMIGAGTVREGSSHCLYFKRPIDS
jgi:hypothetical protein